MESDASLLILTTKEIENYLKVQHLAEPEISAETVEKGSVREDIF